MPTIDKSIARAARQAQMDAFQAEVKRVILPSAGPVRLCRLSLAGASPV